MAASTGAGRICLLLVTVFQAYLVNGACTIDECCCFSDTYDEAVPAKIAAFTSPPTPPEFQYIGAIPKANDVYEPCMCSDVTRVTTDMKLTKSEYITKANDTAQRPDLETEVTTELNALQQTMKNSEADLVNTLLSIKSVYKSHTAEEVIMTVEILLRGRNEAINEPVKTALGVGLAKGTLGNVDSGIMIYTVVKCAADPPDARINGQRVVNTDNIASSIAVYTCNDRYNMSSNNAEETITCDHANLQWTALPEDLACVPNIAMCSEDPPSAPQYTESSWDQYSKNEGTVVSYACLDGYSSKDALVAMSMCKSGEWSTILASFECIQTGCLEAPPQVPTQGILDWQGGRADKTKVTYSCKERFKSNTGVNPSVQCINFTWIGYPQDWACVDENVKLRLGGIDDGEEEELNYFLIVTIPSVAGLIILIVCCLCCTRVDSPLFSICNSRGGPVSSGYTSA